WLRELDESGPNKDVRSALQNAYKEFNAMSNRRAMKMSAFNAWEQVGTSQESKVSGRASHIAFHPTDASTLYLATAQGGLWRTTDLGTSWVNLSGSWPTLAMGAVTLDPFDPNIIYAGTGDHAGPDGVGILKSTDAGLNWVSIASSALVGQKVLKIIVDPVNTKNVFASTNNGVHKSTDAGATWTKVLSLGGYTTIVMNSNDPNNLLAAMGSEVRRTSDAGETWMAVGENLPGSNRTVIAMSPSDPNYVYVSLSVGGASHVGRSMDNGLTWEVISLQVDYLGDQGWYANAIVIDPKNPKAYVVGGLDVYRSANGGTPQKRSNWTASKSSSNYTHADIQYLAYGIDALYCLSDGGIYRSTDNASTWSQNMNATLATLQFMGFDAPPDLSYYLGGTQDNGVIRTEGLDMPFEETAGGDGGRTWVAQSDPSIAFSTYVQANLQRSDDGGRTWRRGDRGDHNIINNDTLLNESAPFYMQYSVNEADASLVAISGNRRVWLSQDGGISFNSATRTSGAASIAGGPNAVHWAEQDPLYLYASGRTGNFHYSTDFGENWTKSAQKIGIASGIETHPRDARKVYAAIQGYGGAHFYLSTDNGETWTAPATNMPDVSALSIAVSDDGVIFIGHQLGVIVSQDNGVTWEPLREGLPLVQIMSLSIRGSGANTYLLAGTYGRGGYRLNISDIKQQASTVEEQISANTFTKLSTNVIDRKQAKVELTASIDGHALLSAKLYDYLGREVRNLYNDYTSGQARVQLDLSEIAAGKYFIVVSASGKSNSLGVTVL
ncbi:MAG TPA: hypothetical protein VFH43_11265, partial [Candidatus Kapabacteria bacterium]|nr:hypothetical protein [Candidatus Kapabacteria bacterium]